MEMSFCAEAYKFCYAEKIGRCGHGGYLCCTEGKMKCNLTKFSWYEDFFLMLEKER